MAETDLAEALRLLDSFVSEDPCIFDHNGFCQEHWGSGEDYKCDVMEAKKLLERHGLRDANGNALT